MMKLGKLNTEEGATMESKDSSKLNIAIIHPDLGIGKLLLPRFVTQSIVLYIRSLDEFLV